MVIDFRVQAQLLSQMSWIKLSWVAFLTFGFVHTAFCQNVRSVPPSAANSVSPNPVTVDVFSLSVRPDSVTITDCDPAKIGAAAVSCSPRSESSERIVPRAQFERHLRTSLLLNRFGLLEKTEQLQIELLGATHHQKNVSRDREQILAQQKDRMIGLVRFVCGATDAAPDCSAKNPNVIRLAELNKELAERLSKQPSEKHNLGLEPGTSSKNTRANGSFSLDETFNQIDRTIDQLIDEVLQSGKTHVYLVPATSVQNSLADSAPFRVLSSYVRFRPSAMSFSEIRPGSFMMGSPKSQLKRYKDEGPLRVDITHGFSLGATPVTQSQWYAVMATVPSAFSTQKFCPTDWMEVGQKGKKVTLCANLPVDSVSFHDVRDFLTKLNAEDPIFRYRLPTEAEWEYAAKAGSNSTYFFGDDDAGLNQYAWYAANSSGHPHEVGTLKGNAWGLFDMSGNVFEWVDNWYDTSLTNSNLQLPATSENHYKVIRGGAWFSLASAVRSASRNNASPGVRYGGVGFRLVRSKK